VHPSRKFKSKKIIKLREAKEVSNVLKAEAENKEHEHNGESSKRYCRMIISGKQKADQLMAKVETGILRIPVARSMGLRPASAETGLPVGSKLAQSVPRLEEALANLKGVHFGLSFSGSTRV
jgi:hypothetical protein